MVPSTMAVKCCSKPCGTIDVTGFTIIVVTVGAVGEVTPGGTICVDPAEGAGTVTVAVPLLEVSAVDVALTVRVPGV